MTNGDATRLRIGQVVELLRDEFPDISISKLRFLQDKGIINPARTAGGYRSYADADVEALRVALRLQRDQFMPLRVIRDELRRQLDERGSAAAGGSTGNPTLRIQLDTAPDRRGAPGDGPQAGVVNLGRPEPLLSADALVRSAGVDHGFLDTCRSVNIVSGQVDTDGTLRYTQDEVGMVACARAVVDLGLDIQHVRQVVLAAARQGAVVEQRAASLLRARGDGTHERAIATVEQLTEQLARLMRIAFVRDVKLTTASVEGSVQPEPAHRIAAPIL